jgi:DNA processing protein
MRLLMDERFLFDLIISRLLGVNPREKVRLCMEFEPEGEWGRLSRGDLESFLGRSLEQVPWDMGELWAQAERDRRALQTRGIAVVSILSPRYPPLLRELWDPPAILFYRGILPDPEKPLAAVVGTRRPTQGALSQAYRISRELGEAGIPVVSGLALGIDAMAHRGNLDGGAPTVAVLGSSPDEVYPGANRMLARRILSQGGAVLSEYPPGSSPRKWTFPARNRIISGMSRGTVVVEAPAASGALITARFALDQDRDFWVASAGVESPRGAGTAKLAGEGAAVLTGAADILENWGIEGGEVPHEELVSGGRARGADLASSLARTLKITL